MIDFKIIKDSIPLKAKCQADTRDGDIIITLPKGTGKYMLEIIPLEKLNG